jgi:hypothetical protein
MSHACKFLANYLFLDPRERERGWLACCREELMGMETELMIKCRTGLIIDEKIKGSSKQEYHL